MDVKLPKLGEGADSGVVVNLFVKEGDTVAKDQAILELENEKAVASIPSTGAGVVAKIYVKPGDRISVGQRILTLNEAGQPATAAPAPTGGKESRTGTQRACAESWRSRRERERRGTSFRRCAGGRRHRCARWRANWALICGRCAAVNPAGGLSSAICGITSSG